MRTALALIAFGLASSCGSPKPLTPSGLDAGVWHELNPGGGAICSRGTPYRFYVWPGTTNKVMIDFIGGGACWTYASCSFAGRLFNDSLERLASSIDGGAPGIYAKKPDSPLRDWWHVVLPYCTGDIHWGDAESTYTDDAGSPPLTLRHRGAVNAKASLAWVYENFVKPERIMVQGCSAGAYGAIYWAPHIQQKYPGVPLVQFGDSGNGVITESFFRESFPRWNAQPNAANFIPELAQADWNQLTLPKFYAIIGKHFPSMKLSQLNTEQDDNQKFFYQAMGGRREDWAGRMRANVSEMQQTLGTQFEHYLAPGDQHCVLPNDNLTSFSSGGVRFADWYTALAEGRPTPQVRCTECDAGP
jgi:hypothetical protein